MLGTPVAISELLHKAGEEEVSYNGPQLPISHRLSEIPGMVAGIACLLPADTSNKAESPLTLSTLHISSEFF